MTKLEAVEGAAEIANTQKLRMIVAHNPYDGDEPDTERRYGFWPFGAETIFTKETVILTIIPESWGR